MSRWAIALACLLVSGRVLADDAADIAAARELGVEGVKLADAGKCAEAIERLSRAEALHHAPTILGRLGECQVEVGKLVEGTENLQRVVREPLAPNAPPAFVAAVERAKKVLAAAQPKIAKLTIVVSPAEAKPTVTIDGVTISQALIGTARPIDPGPHEVKVRAEGFLDGGAKVTLAASESAKLEVKLEPVPVVAPPPEPAKVAPPPPPPAKEPKSVAVQPDSDVDEARAGRTAAWVALGVGAVGLVSGATFGFVAIDARKTLDRECPEKRCPAASEEELVSAKRWAALSTVGFVLAGAGVGISAFLFATTPSKTTASITPVIGLGAVGLRGEF